MSYKDPIKKPKSKVLSGKENEQYYAFLKSPVYKKSISKNSELKTLFKEQLSKKLKYTASPIVRETVPWGVGKAGKRRRWRLANKISTKDAPKRPPHIYPKWHARRYVLMTNLVHNNEGLVPAQTIYPNISSSVTIGVSSSSLVLAPRKTATQHFAPSAAPYVNFEWDLSNGFVNMPLLEKTKLIPAVTVSTKRAIGQAVNGQYLPISSNNLGTVWVKESSGDYGLILSTIEQKISGDKYYWGLSTTRPTSSEYIYTITETITGYTLPLSVINKFAGKGFHIHPETTLISVCSDSTQRYVDRSVYNYVSTQTDPFLLDVFISTLLPYPTEYPIAFTTYLSGAKYFKSVDYSVNSGEITSKRKSKFESTRSTSNALNGPESTRGNAYLTMHPVVSTFNYPDSSAGSWCTGGDLIKEPPPFYYNLLKRKNLVPPITLSGTSLPFDVLYEVVTYKGYTKNSFTNTRYRMKKPLFVEYKPLKASNALFINRVGSPVINNIKYPEIRRIPIQIRNLKSETFYLSSAVIELTGNQQDFIIESFEQSFISPGSSVTFYISSYNWDNVNYSTEKMQGSLIVFASGSNTGFNGFVKPFLYKYNGVASVAKTPVAKRVINKKFETEAAYQDKLDNIRRKKALGLV